MSLVSHLIIAKQLHDMDVCIQAFDTTISIGVYCCYYCWCLLQELAAQCLVFAQLGFTHSTFLSNVAYLAPEFVPHCGPRGLADLALAFSKYRWGDLGNVPSHYWQMPCLSFFAVQGMKLFVLSLLFPRA